MYAIHVIQGMQRKGIGRKLTLEVVNSLKNRGLTSMIVRALAENPCRRFYERLGGKIAGKRYIEISADKLQEVAYAWDDSDSLVAELAV